MPFIYVEREYLPCDECGWSENGACSLADDVFEYECPNYNDPEPKYIPAEVPDHG